MPEGDTIHAAAARLAAALVGDELVRCSASRLGGTMPAPGYAVERVEARGKHLLVWFGDGLALHTHLGLNGSWRIRPAGAGARPTHGTARATIETQRALAACNRPSVVEVLDAPAARRHPVLRALGPDLTLDGADVDGALERLARLVGAGATVGDALLDQRPACGIGNVIMQETCLLVGVHPSTPVELVDQVRRRQLYETASALLVANVTTARRTTVTGGRPGELYVYDRAGRPCRRCGTAIAHARSGRGARPTYWCPSCQPTP